MKFLYGLAAVTFIFLVSSHTAFASLVLPVNVEGLVEKSDVAFTGVCTEAKAHLIFPKKAPEGLLVTTYTFDILPEGALKGKPPKVFTFSQWGATVEESKLYGLPYPIGIPKYKVGNVYTLFLTAETELGVRAPVGLGHGNFNMIERPDGEIAVMNDYGNKSLFSGLPATKAMSKALSASGISRTSPPAGPIDYDTFKKVIMNLQGGE